MRTILDEQLDYLNRELIVMGSLCETAIAKAAKALTEHNQDLATQVLESATQIDQKESDIEGICLKILLRHHPVAHDLRLISAALKMITDMERIGDQAEDIAQIVTMTNLSNTLKNSHISDMAIETIKMVSKSIDAYVEKNKELALEVIAQDDVVDDLFIEVRKELISTIKKGEDDEAILDMLMVAKYLERIGDHATNIAEWVVFSITGEHNNAKLTESNKT